MLDSPAVSAGYVATINTCLRGVSWSGAALLDVARDHDPVTDAGPFLGLAAGSTGTSCSTERRCWFGDGGADGTALTMQGAMRWADVVTTLVRAGGYQ
jgi:hypothetical protein